MTEPTPQTTPTRDETVLSAAEIERIIDTYVRAQIKFSTDLTTVTILGKGTAASSIANRLASAPPPASGRVDAVLDAAVEAYREKACWAIVPANHRDALRAALAASLSPAATPVSEAGGEAITACYTNWQGVTAERTFIPHRVFFGSNEWHPEPQVLIEATDCEKGALRTFAAAGFSPVPEFTYSSTQATKCAGCGEHKHTPLRRDEMGGYVCLTCIDKALAKPASSPAGVSIEAVIAAIQGQKPASQDMTSTFICEALERAIDAVRALSQSTSAGRVGE